MPRLRPDRPNVVVFFTDQQLWDSFGLHPDTYLRRGEVAGKSPHLP